MIKRIKVSILLLFLLFNIKSFSQEVELDNYKEYLKKSIKHNFLISYYNNIKFNNMIFTSNFENVIPPCNNWDIDIEFKKVDSLFYKDYILISAIPKVGLYCKEMDKKYTFNNLPKEQLYGYGQEILIAIREKENSFELKFLSGRLILSSYSSDFNLETDYHNYLELKLFTDKVSNIKFIKKNRKWLYFSTTKLIFSVKKKVFYRINRLNTDLVQYLGCKMSGKYSKKEKENLYFGTDTCSRKSHK